MALNQQFLAVPGRTGLVARVEQPAEPAGPAGPAAPRLFWDGAAAAWSKDPAARVAVVADPTLPGGYLVQVPSTSTVTWPPKAYWITVVDPAADPANRLVAQWSAWVVGGDDGSLPLSAADLMLPDGRRLHMPGAYIR